MRTAFQQDLDVLEATLQEEGELVLRALRGAIKALETRDEELADEVIAFDDDVDERYVRIEEEIQLLLARQTPVATDLRLVLAILHVNLHLERMADYCVTIAKLTKAGPRSRSWSALRRRVRGDGLALRGDDQDCPWLLRRP
jgi:Phosphate uptake regulator